MSKRSVRHAPPMVIKQRKATVKRTWSSHTNRYGQPKVSFFTKEAAEESASRRGMELRPYVCGECGAWHVGGPR